MSHTDEHTKPKAQTKTDLARLYEVDPRTFAKWLKTLDIVPLPGTYSFTPEQVKQIYEKIGEP